MTGLDGDWVAVARALAENQRAYRRVVEERRRLEQQLMTLLARDREHLVAGRDTDGAAATAEMRVPAWAEERRRFSVEPGHGASTARISPSSPPLSQLSTATPCPSVCREQRLHTHFADGVVIGWVADGLK